MHMQCIDNSYIKILLEERKWNFIQNIVQLKYVLDDAMNKNGFQLLYSIFFTLCLNYIQSTIKYT